ncbi:low molecular weight protein-tyrosine-phosphatase [Thermopetrobacter sp. TC1]|uniref:low molecular weight protein-tyrosine-phosphatase n=1 Tax=Thermopetrobacter sp. TC1 TaxID=1495045 RepID=UPI00056EA949|nr:low molecular weight protein-tyrosine-phosphatase [Thermopetrobacter sp. TC1]
MKILFVCLGNICRSPMAEGVFRAEIARRGLGERVEIDSAGTSDWHVGEPPDPRAVKAAGTRGYNIAHLRGRQVTRQDLAHYDLVLAMDRENLDHLLRMAGPEHAEKVRLFMEFAPSAPEDEVPDPYYGGEEGFAYVLSLLEEAARGLADHVEERLNGPGR